MTKKPASGAHCHKLVAEVAKEAANELYDVIMKDNLVFSEWKRQNPGATAKTLRQAFVARTWGKCIPLARATLARICATATDESLRRSAYDALILDNTLIHGRADPNLVSP
jgi:hypothetical protein